MNLDVAVTRLAYLGVPFEVHYPGSRENPEEHWVITIQSDLTGDQLSEIANMGFGYGLGNGAFMMLGKGFAPPSEFHPGEDEEEG